MTATHYADLLFEAARACYGQTLGDRCDARAHELAVQLNCIGDTEACEVIREVVGAFALDGKPEDVSAGDVLDYALGPVAS